MVDLAALKTEITTDPTGIVYPTGPPADNAGIAGALNLVRPSITFNRILVSPHEIMKNTDDAEFAALTVEDRQRYEILTMRELIPWRLILLTLEPMFGFGSITWSNIDGLQTRKGSRAEELFGERTVVTSANVNEALKG